MPEKRITAAELIAEQERNPDFVAAREREDALLLARAEEWRKAEAALVHDLNQAGAQVVSVWDLVNTRKPYPELVPILLDHITRPYPDRVLEGIGRALAVPDSRIGWRVLVDTFLASPDTTTTGSKWALGLAVGMAATPLTLDELIELIREPRHGENRLALLPALLRIDDPRSRKLLDELKSDPIFARDIKYFRRVQRLKKKTC